MAQEMDPAGGAGGACVYPAVRNDRGKADRLRASVATGIGRMGSADSGTRAAGARSRGRTAMSADKVQKVQIEERNNVGVKLIAGEEADAAAAVIAESYPDAVIEHYPAYL